MIASKWWLLHNHWRQIKNLTRPLTNVTYMNQKWSIEIHEAIAVLRINQSLTSMKNNEVGFFKRAYLAFYSSICLAVFFKWISKERSFLWISIQHWHAISSRSNTCVNTDYWFLRNTSYRTFFAIFFHNENKKNWIKSMSEPEKLSF